MTENKKPKMKLWKKILIGLFVIFIISRIIAWGNSPAISADEVNKIISENSILKQENKRLKDENKKLIEDYEKIKTDYVNMKSLQNPETEPIEKPDGQAKAIEETSNQPSPAITNDSQPGKKLSEKDRKDLAIVFAQDYVESQTGIKMSVGKGEFNVAIQNYSPKHEAYIVTYTDSDNPRIKYIFDWDGRESDGYYENDPWYLLVNGVEYYNELDIKRENAINDN